MKNTRKTVLAVLGGILLGIAIIKFTIIGYLPEDIPLFGVTLVAGGVLSFVASKMPSRIEPETPEGREEGAEL